MIKSNHFAHCRDLYTHPQSSFNMKQWNKSRNWSRSIFVRVSSCHILQKTPRNDLEEKLFSYRSQNLEKGSPKTKQNCSDDKSHSWQIKLPGTNQANTKSIFKANIMTSSKAKVPQCSQCLTISFHRKENICEMQTVEIFFQLRTFPLTFFETDKEFCSKKRIFECLFYVSCSNLQKPNLLGRTSNRTFGFRFLN